MRLLFRSMYGAVLLNLTFATGPGNQFLQAQTPPPAPGSEPSPRPPTIDPGIVQRPKIVPPPKAVVVPPVVDPGMAVDPETREPHERKPVVPKEGETPTPPPAPPHEPIPIPPRTPAPTP